MLKIFLKSQATGISALKENPYRVKAGTVFRVKTLWRILRKDAIKLSVD